jgi:hypothetical protein
MEAHCLLGRINVSDTVAGHAKALIELEPRGPMEAKHERTHEMFFLNRSLLGLILSRGGSRGLAFVRFE